MKLKRNRPLWSPSGLLALLLCAAPIDAASILAGDASTGLTGTLFLDEAATGGGDFTLHDNQGHSSVGIRSLAYGMGEAGTITITGFAFGTSAAAAANDATSISLEFIYLGADGVADDLEDPEPDDVVVGMVENIAYSHSGAGEYYVNFGDESVSAQIDGANDRFRVWMIVNDLNGSLEESIRFKTMTGVGSKLSIAGSFEAGTDGTTWAGYAVDADGWADTGGWLGWVFVNNAPWLYNYSLDAWLYLSEDKVTETGVWAYVSHP